MTMKWKKTGIALLSAMLVLAEMAGSYGFSGNLWHDYLTFLLVNHENAFSTACEITGPVEGSINELAKNDFRIFKSLYDFDITQLDSVFSSTCAALLSDYINVNENSKLFNKRIRDRICSLSSASTWTHTTILSTTIPMMWCFSRSEISLKCTARTQRQLLSCLT